MQIQEAIGLDPPKEQIARLIGRRAENLFETHQLYCSEAVLYVLNQGLGGVLPPETAVRMASGFSEGIGRAGCICGGISGALLAIGMFCGRNGLNQKGAKKIRSLSREFHDRFKQQFGSTCCRVLTKNVRQNRKALIQRCMENTGYAAELAARIILREQPEVIEDVNWDFLKARDSKIGAVFGRLVEMVKSV